MIDTEQAQRVGGFASHLLSQDVYKRQRLAGSKPGAHDQMMNMLTVR